MIKAIFFDIDGTLLSTQSHSILPGTIHALKTLHEKGIRTFISSGRPMVLIPPMPIDFDGYITVNGGYCIVGSNVILRNPINKIDVTQWLRYVEENDIVTMCFTANDMFINRISDSAVRLRDQLGFTMPPVRPLQEMANNDVYQFIAMQPAEDDPRVLELLSHCRMPRWHPAFSDIIPDNSSKAVGIETIISHFGINQDETMAFGDGANDIEMLDYAHIGVAMGNASTIVKQHADYVTLDSNNDGILSALQHFEII